MANKFRAEAEITLGGEVKLMRLTYNAIAEIESDGTPLFVLGRRLGDMTIRVVDLVRMLVAVLNAADTKKRYTTEEVFDFIGDEGLPPICRAVDQLVMRAFIGARKARELQETSTGEASNPVAAPDLIGTST